MKSGMRAALLLGSLALFLALAGARYYSERRLAAVVEGFGGALRHRPDSWRCFCGRE